MTDGLLEPWLAFRQARKELPKDVAAALGRDVPILMRMIKRRGEIETAQYLMEKGTPSKTFRDLKENGCLDLTVEAFVLDNPKWHPLFQKEVLAKTEKRLLDHGYTPKAKITD